MHDLAANIFRIYANFHQSTLLAAVSKKLLVAFNYTVPLRITSELFLIKSDLSLAMRELF